MGATGATTRPSQVDLDRTRAPLDIKALKTIFGVRHRQPKRKQRAGRSEPEVSKEVQRVGPCDVTVFQGQLGKPGAQDLRQGPAGSARGGQSAQYRGT